MTLPGSEQKLLVPRRALGLEDQVIIGDVDVALVGGPRAGNRFLHR